MTTGAWILVVAVVLTVGIGLWRAATDGRFRTQRPAADAADRPAAPAGPDEDVEESPAAALAEAGVEHRLGERATLLQFSSAFCAPCRATRRVLADVAAAVPGVAHVEVDAEQHLDVVRRLGVASTPTTLVLDAGGRVTARATGQPRKEAVLAALDRAIDA